MNTKSLNIVLLFSFLVFVLSGCATIQKKSKPFKHNTPLIKDDIKSAGKKEIDKTIEMGPNPTTVSYTHLRAHET